MKPPPLLGIHHVTAISGGPRQTVSFYRDVLGLRFVKRTVNFDDPGTQHLYFGDHRGQPGTIVTCFPWGDAPRGRAGTGQIAVITFAAPPDSLKYWTARLSQQGVALEESQSSLGQPVLAFRDPDGLQLHLVEQVLAVSDPTRGAVPAEHAIQTIAGVALWEANCEPTVRLLTETLGFALVGDGVDRFRYALPAADRSKTLDLVCWLGGRPGRMGVGAVHHVAWRTTDAASQLAWREELVRLGYRVTPVMDRRYFQSIYFREPGGVLFEIATDGPGFTVDEPLKDLGGSLKLPPWLEADRTRIEATLPALAASSPTEG